MVELSRLNPGNQLKKMLALNLHTFWMYGFTPLILFNFTHLVLFFSCGPSYRKKYEVKSTVLSSSLRQYSFFGMAQHATLQMHAPLFGVAYSED